MNSEWRPVLLRVSLLLGMLAVLFALALLLRPVIPSPAVLQEQVAGAGAWAWPAAVLLLAVLRFGMLPTSVATGTAGLLLGPVAGATAAVLAAALVACLQLWIGRYILGEPVRLQCEGRAPHAMAFVHEHGWLAVVLVRLMPVPHGPFSYAAGGTSLSTGHMAIGTLLGATPMAVAYATIGGNLHDPFSLQVMFSVTALIAVSVGGWLLARRTHRRSSSGRSTSA